MEIEHRNTRLRFGPYLAPDLKIGQIAVCEFRGDIVRIGGWTNAPISWPRVAKAGKHSPIVCGDLVRAIQQEAVSAVAYHWGVSSVTVWKWKKSLNIGRMTEGTREIYREILPQRMSEEDQAKGRARANTPEHAAHMSARRKGVPVSERTRKALLRAAKKKWSAKRKRERKLDFRRRIRQGELPQPPKPARPWTEKELSLLGKTTDRKVAEMIDRSLYAVRSKRKSLGIPMSRHSKLHQEPKPKS